MPKQFYILCHPYGVTFCFFVHLQMFRPDGILQICHPYGILIFISFSILQLLNPYGVINLFHFRVINMSPRWDSTNISSLRDYDSILFLIYKYVTPTGLLYIFILPFYKFLTHAGYNFVFLFGFSFANSPAVYFL